MSASLGTIGATRVITATPASLVSTERQAFVKADWYPADVLTLIAGRAGEGKSTLALSDISAATRGNMDGDYMGQKLVCAITATEDTKAMQVARLQAAGADLDKVTFLDAGTRVGGETLESVPVIPLDLAGIRAKLTETGATIWAIDPITALVAGDSNRRDDVRAALDPLHALARELHIAIVGILHFNKGGGFASDKISGSHAFRDVARSLLLVAHDSETDEHVVTLDKSNYSMAAGSSWRFDLTDTVVQDSEGADMHIPRITGMAVTDTDVNTVINKEMAQNGDDGDDRNAAQAFILDYLNNTDALEAPAGDVLKAGHGAGFSDNDLKNARKRSKDPKIVSRKASFGSGWSWAVDVEGVTKVSKVSKVSHSQELTPSTPSARSVTPSDDPKRLRIVPNSHEETPAEKYQRLLNEKGTRQ